MAVTDGEFELFSDNESRIKYLSGVFSFIFLITAANWIIGINNIFLIASHSNPINYVGILNIAPAILGTFGCIRLLRKQKKLKQESQLFE